jgi:hypothetical protein
MAPRPVSIMNRLSARPMSRAAQAIKPNVADEMHWPGSDNGLRPLCLTLADTVAKVVLDRWSKILRAVGLVFR